MDAVLSYCHYSLNDLPLRTLIHYLKSKGVGIINASLLSMGFSQNRHSLAHIFLRLRQPKLDP